MATSRATSTKNKKTTMRDGAFGGFTIIEVVLVLAIAGLIFLMVLIALPQLQRAQRDTQRRNDMSRISAAITQFQTNNNGKTPNQIEDYTVGGSKGGSYFVERYIVDEYVDPDGEDYDVRFYDEDIDSANSAVTNEAHVMAVVNRAVCGSEEAAAANNVRDFAILYKLEGSGVACIDSGGTAKNADTKK